MTRKKWAQGLWIAVAAVLAFGLYYRWSVLDAYNRYLLVNNLGNLKVPEAVYARSMIFLVLATQLALVREWILQRQSWSKAEKQFRLAEIGLWFLTGICWLWNCVTQLETYLRPDYQWYGKAGLDTVRLWGPLLVLFYILSALYQSWPELKAEWSSGRSLWGKLLYSPVILIFGGLRRQNTGAGKILYVLGAGYFLYLITAAGGLSMGIGPDALLQRICMVPWYMIYQLYPVTVLMLFWWFSEKSGKA